MITVEIRRLRIVRHFAQKVLPFIPNLLDIGDGCMTICIQYRTAGYTTGKGNSHAFKIAFVGETTYEACEMLLEWINRYDWSKTKMSGGVTKYRLRQGQIAEIPNLPKIPKKI